MSHTPYEINNYLCICSVKDKYNIAVEQWYFGIRNLWMHMNHLACKDFH